MKRRAIVTGLVILLTLAVGGAAAAAGPMAADGAGHGFGRAMGGIVVRVANFLGVEVPVVQEARAEGQTLADILGDKTEAFIAASIVEREAFLAQLVTSGDITAEQAALCMAQVEDKLTERLTSDSMSNGVGNFANHNAVKRMVQRRQNSKVLLHKGL